MCTQMVSNFLSIPSEHYPLLLCPPSQSLRMPHSFPHCTSLTQDPHLLSFLLLLLSDSPDSLCGLGGDCKPAVLSRITDCRGDSIFTAPQPRGEEETMDRDYNDCKLPHWFEWTGIFQRTDELTYEQVGEQTAPIVNFQISAEYISLQGYRIIMTKARSDKKPINAAVVRQ